MSVKETHANFTLPNGWRVTVSLELIGPDEAAKYLGKNVPKNRNVRPAGVDAMARHMEGGTFPFTGSTVVIDTQGRMIDGQHRMLAILKSGKTIPMLVVTGVGEDAFPYFDINTAREVSDNLSVTGRALPNESIVKSIAGLLIKADETLTDRQNDRPFVADYMWDHRDELVPWASWAKGTLSRALRFTVSQKHVVGHRADTKAATPSTLGALGYVMAQHGASVDHIQQFLEAVVRGGVITDPTAAPFVTKALAYLTEVQPLSAAGGSGFRRVLGSMDTVIRFYNGWRTASSTVVLSTSARSGHHTLRFITDLEKAVAE